MARCPECGSANLFADPNNPDERSDGQGYQWVISNTYTCNRCGCEFTEIEETNRSVEIEKHGKEYVP